MPKQKKRQFLCDRSALKDLESRGFTVKLKRKTTGIFLVRKDDKVYGYENRCPHANSPLDEAYEHAFLDEDKRYIQCSNHDALFNIESGECKEGLCNGVGLERVALDVSDDKIFLAS